MDFFCEAKWYFSVVLSFFMGVLVGSSLRFAEDVFIPLALMR